MSAACDLSVVYYIINVIDYLISPFCGARANSSNCLLFKKTVTDICLCVAAWWSILWGRDLQMFQYQMKKRTSLSMLRVRGDTRVHYIAQAMNIFWIFISGCGVLAQCWLHYWPALRRWPIFKPTSWKIFCLGISNLSSCPFIWH